MVYHGVAVAQKATGVTTPVVADSGIPFVVGTAPAHSAEKPAKTGVPVMCTSWTEAVSRLGFSEDWESYTLCEFMYSHFKLYGCQPVIFCNVISAEGMSEAVSAADMELTDHKIKLPLEAADDDTLVIKAAGGTGEAYIRDTDYSTYYDGEYLIAEAIPEGAIYTAAQVNVAYSKITPEKVSRADIAEGIESIELCMPLFGTVPDIICAPGFSGDSVIAALMATKASGINGLFKAKALIDIDSGAEGVTDYSEALQHKNSKNLTDEDEILCWPMLKLGDYQFHMSTQLAGLMAQVDTGNGGCPYESPSNKNFQCDGAVLKDGAEVNLTLEQANILNSNGIVTALSFMNGWTCWGNNTACYPSNTDVKDYFVPVSRMFGWVGTTLVRTFWSKIDKPMTRRYIDTIIDTANIWMNGLVSAGYLLGGRIEFSSDENPTTDLMAGIMRFHIYMTPASPAQEIDFTLEYDASYVESALTA